jgi:acetyl-CoA C-acetyltransferase
MSEIVITAALRTPIGSFGGAFKDTGAVDLGALTIKAYYRKPDWIRLRWKR